jgi:nicotinate-nucleotide adenylyltransferase
MRKVALFGGSFDPPHLGHEAIVKALNKLDYIDKIIVMPTFLNPFKSSSFAPAKLRLKWLEEAFGEFTKVEVSSYEVSQNQKVPTIETVNHLLKSYEKIYLVIGADNLKSLKKWFCFDELKDKVTFIVASREKIEIPKEFIRVRVNENISSTTLRNKIDKNYLPKINAEEITQYYKEKNEQ